jgi:hypothetical protein
MLTIDSPPRGTAARTSAVSRSEGTAGQVAGNPAGVLFPKARFGRRWLSWRRQRSTRCLASARVSRISDYIRSFRSLPLKLSP